MLNRIMLWGNIIAIYLAISSTHVFIAWGTTELVLIVVVFELVRLLAIQSQHRWVILALAVVSIFFISFNYNTYYDSKIKYDDLTSTLVQEVYTEHLNNTKDWFKDKNNILSIKSVREVTQIMKETAEEIEGQRKQNSQKKPISPWVVFLIMCVSELGYAIILHKLATQQENKVVTLNSLSEVTPPKNSDLVWESFVNSSKVVNYKGKYYTNNKEVLDAYGK